MVYEVKNKELLLKDNLIADIGDIIKVYYICNEVSLITLTKKDSTYKKSHWIKISVLDNNKKLLKVINSDHIPQRRKIK